MLKGIEKILFNKKNLSLLPETYGVYVFWSKNKPLYIGKSVNLKSRIKSYKSLNLGPKTAKMISLTSYFSYIKVSSEIESLLLEAKLVNTLQTPYNIQLKDDKHPLYIKITKDKYPQVLTTRKIKKGENVTEIFGPFPSSSSIKNALTLIRKIFPFAQHLPQKKPCLYSQMGLCNPCPSNIENFNDINYRNAKTKEYYKNIKYIRNFLKGNLKGVIQILNKEMKYYSEQENFEYASILKNKIQTIEYIITPKHQTGEYLKNPNLVEDIKDNELNDLKIILSKYIPIKKLNRIECYDVAHISGSFPTASMVTFINASAEKKYYRHFKIRKGNNNDDISNLKEVALRRIKHISDWGKPDLIVVDGGKGQVITFENIFKNINIPIIGISKKKETIVIHTEKYKSNSQAFTLIDLKKGNALNLIQRLRNEAHRFARRLHHKIIEKNYFS